MTQAGEFIDSAALALLTGKTGSVVTKSPDITTSLPSTKDAMDDKESLGGMLESACPVIDEENLRWKDAEESGDTDIDPTDAEFDPLGDGLVALDTANMATNTTVVTPGALPEKEFQP
ncbi:MAG: hypothetical protein HQM09_02835 [Candidatus Riflebacteria bacterium]|nr:hypothetical protein [Candidatus Riflebacteria bacterium]